MKSLAPIIAVITLTLGNLFAALPLRAQPFHSTDATRQGIQEERGIVALDQALRELANPFTVMAIAARPEDADYATLAYYRKKLGARTVILFATRGESGGSNPASPAVNFAIINTQKAVEAAQSIGADVYFLNLSDLGYINSVDKILSQWGHEEAHGRMVRAIRLLRPDIIFACHRLETSNDQQRAVYRLAIESFTAAGDGEKFKEDNTGVWRARRLFQPGDQANSEVTVNSGQFDHLRGLTYDQISESARRLVEQAATSKTSPGKQYYKLIRSSPEEKMQPGSGFLDGLVLPEKLRRPLAAPIIGDRLATELITQRERLIESLREKMTEKRAEGSAEKIRERYGEQFFRILRYTETLERALALAYGLSFSIEAEDAAFVPGLRFTAKLSIRNGSEYPLKVIFHTPGTIPLSSKPVEYKPSESLDLLSGDSTLMELSYEIPKDAPLTLPRDDRLYDENYYPVGSVLPGGRTGGVFGNRLVALAEVLLPDTNIFLPAQLRFDIASPVEIETLPFVLLKNWESSREVEIPVRLRNRLPGELTGALWVVSLALRNDDYQPAHVAFSHQGQEVDVRLRLTIPILKPPLTPDILMEFRRERPAPPDPLAKARIEVKALDFAVAEGLKVAVVGDDSWTEFALEQMDVKHTVMRSDIIKSVKHGANENISSQTRCGDLGSYDSIIVAENALSEKSNVSSLTDCLLGYAHRGGNLIVLRQEADIWNSGKQPAPFMIRMSEAQVSGSDSYAKILDETHPLVTSPNRITSNDLYGWKQIMAASMPVGWSPEYTALIEATEIGGAPQKGALLVTRLGEGSYIYTSLALGRQIANATPGAYKLLANMISFGKVIKEQSSK